MDNYFKIFDIAIDYEINLELFENKYLKLLKKYHPDSNLNKNEEEQLFCLNQSILINKAYQTLIDPTSRIFYLLKLNNIELDSESNIISDDFLSQIFEYRVSIDEVPDTSLNELENSVIYKITQSIENFKDKYLKDINLAINEAIKIKYYSKILEKIKAKKL